MTRSLLRLQEVLVRQTMAWRFRHHLVGLSAGALLSLISPATRVLGGVLIAATFVWDYVAHRVRRTHQARTQRQRLDLLLRERGVRHFYEEGIEHRLEIAVAGLPFGSRRLADVSPVHYLRYEWMRHLLQRVGAPPVRRHLDLGCKEGMIGRALTGPGIQLTGVDLDEMALAHYARNTGGFPVRADVAHLPFRKASAHTVSLLEVIEHLENPLAALAEVRRVLHPKGLLFLSTNNRSAVLVDHLANPLVLAERALGLYFPRVLPPAQVFWEKPHLTWAFFHTEFARSELLALLRQAAFRPVALQTYYLAAGLDGWLARLCPGVTDAQYCQ